MAGTDEIKNEIIADIARKARHYTPEWRLNESSPDAGSALAMIWADMFSGTLERFELLPDNCYRALLDAVGSDPLPAIPARGWLAFDMRDDAGEVTIPAGTAVSAPSDPSAVMITDRELTASPAKITDIFCVTPGTDMVVRYDKLTDLELFAYGEGGDHVWTFEHEYAFEISDGASLRLVPEFNGGNIETLTGLRWEYSDGESWREMSAVRDGNVLRCTFPHGKTERVNAIRVTVARHIAGDTALRGLTAFPAGAELKPDALYAGFTQETDGFFAFGRRFMPGECACFTCADALTKPGARVEFSFTLDFEKNEIEGYPEREIRLKRLMRESDFTPPEEYEITVSEVKWEYFNGTGWAELGVTVDGGGLFSGKRTGRTAITFTCPHDMQNAVVGAHDLPFIRARIISADNLYRQRGYYLSPKISNAQFSYRYERGVSVVRVTVAEHLDMRETTFPIKLAAPPDSPAAIYFAFNRPFSQGALLFDIANGTRDPAARWEYAADSGWNALGTLDNTAGLSVIGVLSYQVTDPPVLKRLWGTEAYWMRFRTGGVTPRRLRLLGLYENAVRATAATPGTASVLPANAFTTIIAPISGVESVFNPLETYGGADAEHEDATVSRLGSAFTHAGRAVSSADTEALAREASVRVFKARIYPRTDETGAEAYGQSCLVLLPRNAETRAFSALRDEVRAYIEPRRALDSGVLHIIPPRYFEVGAQLRVVLSKPDESLTMRYRILQTLEDLLSPLVWEIGQLPSPGQIETAVRATPGVAYVTHTTVTYSLRGIASGYERAGREPFALPVSGVHEIIFER